MKLSYDFGSMCRRLAWHGKAFVWDGQASLIAGAKDEPHRSQTGFLLRALSLYYQKAARTIFTLLGPSASVAHDVQRRR
jgi:hypothetical protein